MYSKKCAVYSFGITVWEVMSRKRPFYNMDYNTLIPKKKK